MNGQPAECVSTSVRGRELGHACNGARRKREKGKPLKVGELGREENCKSQKSVLSCPLRGGVQMRALCGPSTI